MWQLAGRKRVCLFPPAHWEDLYPFAPSNEGRTSWAFCRTSAYADPASTVEHYPRFARAMAARAEVVLDPGEILYLPAGWAHEVAGELGAEPHVLSVNRFWHTPLAKTWFLPEQVKAFLVANSGGALVAK